MLLTTCSWCGPRPSVVAQSMTSIDSTEPLLKAFVRRSVNVWEVLGLRTRAPRYRSLPDMLCYWQATNCKVHRPGDKSRQSTNGIVTARYRAPSKSNTPPAPVSFSKIRRTPPFIPNCFHLRRGLKPYRAWTRIYFNDLHWLKGVLPNVTQSRTLYVEVLTQWGRQCIYLYTK